MPTSKIQVRSKEEFMNDYVPTYQPLFALLLGKSQSYAETVGDVNFRRAEAVGDIRAAHMTPKDTEMKVITVSEGKKTFKKYFLGTKFIQSSFQEDDGNESVIAQVLDEHQKQADSMLLFGDGASNGAQVNNSLIYSSDANHVTKSGATISATDTLILLHSQVAGIAEEANQISGKKAILYYGSTMSAKLNSLHSSSNNSVRKTLSEALPGGTQIIQIPTEVAPAGNGYVVANLDQVKLHYAALPKVAGNGVNDEFNYAWWNFLMGSMMVEVLAKKGVIHQPLTFS
jgi:hypothetical protein